MLNEGTEMSLFTYWLTSVLERGIGKRRHLGSSCEQEHIHMMIHKSKICNFTEKNLKISRGDVRDELVA